MQLLLFRMANFFLGTAQLLTNEPGEAYTPEPWVTQVTDLIKKLINPALIIAGTAGMVYAIVLGVKMAKADEQGKRDEAKKNLINVLIAIVATILLVALFYLFTYWIEKGSLSSFFSKPKD